MHNASTAQKSEKKVSQFSEFVCVARHKIRYTKVYYNNNGDNISNKEHRNKQIYFSILNVENSVCCIQYFKNFVGAHLTVRFTFHCI